MSNAPIFDAPNFTELEAQISKMPPGDRRTFAEDLLKAARREVLLVDALDKIANSNEPIAARIARRALIALRG